MTKMFPHLPEVGLLPAAPGKPSSVTGPRPNLPMINHRDGKWETGTDMTVERIRFQTLKSHVISRPSFVPAGDSGTFRVIWGPFI